MPPYFSKTDSESKEFGTKQYPQPAKKLKSLFEGELDQPVEVLFTKWHAMPEPKPKFKGAPISQRRYGTKKVWLSAKARNLTRGFSNPGQALWPVADPPLTDAVEVLHPRALEASYERFGILRTFGRENPTDNFVVCGSNQDVCSKFAIMATISGTNPLMKMAVAPNLDHRKKVRGENTHTHTKAHIHAQAHTLAHPRRVYTAHLYIQCTNFGHLLYLFFSFHCLSAFLPCLSLSFAQWLLSFCDFIPPRFLALHGSCGIPEGLCGSACFFLALFTLVLHTLALAAAVAAAAAFQLRSITIIPT